MTGPLWTITMLTIPARAAFLQRLLASLTDVGDPSRFEVIVVYNAATDEEPQAIERRIRALAPSLSIRVYLNTSEATIGAGRRLQLGVCRTPLVAFVDDDLTLHGDVLGTLEDALRSRPLGIVGLPSFEEDTDTRFKPRESTPYVVLEDFRYMPVQGMLVAGYRRLFADIGGFNVRRQFWGEWTELNLRMWRHGFPTAYVMDRAYLRHWHKAPESPTRNMAGRERHVLWGLMCTALEYDAVSINEATDAFWTLAQDRYLAYSFGEQPSPRQLLASVLELMPRLSEEWPAMHAFAQQARKHPFQFKPFEPLSDDQVREVLAHADRVIDGYRPATLADPPAAAHREGWLTRMLRAARGRAAQGGSAAALLGLLACTTAERPAPLPDTTTAARGADTVGTTDRIASDATLTITTPGVLHAALRVVADSFAAREAVTVVLDTLPPASAAPVVEPEVDVRIAPVATFEAMARADSLADWYVPFAGLSAASTPEFGLGIPASSANVSSAERFVRYLLSDSGLALLRTAGLSLPDRLTAYGGFVPQGIAAAVDTIVARPAPRAPLSPPSPPP